MFLNVKLFFNKELKQLFFVINLFNLKIFGGYAQIVSDGIVIHLTKYYAIIIPFKSLLGINKKVKPLKDYHVIKFNCVIDTGNNNETLKSLSYIYTTQFLFEKFKWYIKNKKPYVRLKQEINLYEGKNLLNVSLNTTVIFNFLMIILSVLKISVGKVIYAIRRKKQSN